MGEVSAPRPSSSYQEALSWLYGTQLFGIKLGLESVQRLFAALNLFESWQPKIIHVAGTNGKGSVCAMIDAMLRAGVYRTGLFTSPHLVTFRERIQINGEKISEDAVTNGLTSIRALIAGWDPHPTFFEIVTALGLLHFKKNETEFVVLETGMGGRVDATNATQPVVSVITPIDLDHQKWLGHTLPEIAREKAGIIKPKTPVVSAMQLREAEEVIRTRARECDAPLEFVGKLYQGRIGLAGEHQKQNAALAVAALRPAGVRIEQAALEKGLAEVRWPARFQQWDQRTFIDGAHNPAGAKTLTKTWHENFPDQLVTIVLAVLQDKDISGILRALAPIARRFVLPQIRSVRGVHPETLAQFVADITPSLPCSIAPSLAAALKLARQASDAVLITGSLHFAGEALAHLQGVPAAYEECAQ